MPSAGAASPNGRLRRWRGVSTLARDACGPCSLRAAQTASSTWRIDGWLAVIARLPPRKQNDKWNVSQRVRYVPGGRTIGEGPDTLTTYFEVWKQANREKGHAWWPVLSHESLQEAGGTPGCAS